MKLDWDLDGERLFEVGTDRGVVYPYDYENGTYGTGYAWNGLTGVDESPSGAEENAIYANNDKYANNRSKEEFAGTINAYTYPEEFELCDGTAMFDEEGMRVKQQKRKKFAFSYRSLIGNDIEGDDYGYKIHLFYNCMASPSSKSMETVNNDPNAATFSWELSTTPIEIDGMNRSAHIIIDSRNAFPASLKMLEDMLYGTEDTEPKMPTVDELRDLYPQITLSGPFVSFIDGAPDQPVASLKADINLDQDLHGYEYSWIGGTGKNLIDASSVYAVSGGTASYDSVTDSITASGSQSYAAASISISLKAGTTYAFSAHGVPDDESATWRTGLRIGSESVITRNSGLKTGEADASFTYTASEDVTGRFVLFVNYSSEALSESRTIVFSKVQVETGSEVTAYEPYSNICPIEGVSAVNVTRLGKNLVKSTGYNRNTVHGVTFVKNSDGSYTANGTNDIAQGGGAVNTCWSSMAVFDELPAGDYYFTGGVLPSDKANTYMWDITANASAKKWDGVTDCDANAFGGFSQFKVVEGHRYSLRFRIRFSQTVENVTAYPMVCQAFETDPTYEKYNDTVYTVQLGDTVYGGELDAATGILTATMKYMELTGTEGFSMSGVVISMQRSAYDTAKTSGRIVSDRFKSVSAVSGVKFGSIIISNAANGIIQFTNNDLYFATVEDFQAWLASEYAAETPVQICYELKTPLPIQLTPQQITTLLGRNTFWADTGDIELTYRATDIHD